MTPEQAAFNLAVALCLSAVIGFERQWRNRLAGLRTNTLVALGAATFVVFEQLFPDESSPTRVAAQVVSGIGFLGAGLIFREGLSVRGLNTAATLWASAAVGSCAGADMIAQSAALTIFVLAGNTLLRPLVNAIDRIPLSERSSEAVYEISVVTDARRAAEVRDFVNEHLAAASYPVRETKIIFHSDDNVEVSAILVPLVAERNDLDNVVSDLLKVPGVSHATWSMRALE